MKKITKYLFYLFVTSLLLFICGCTIVETPSTDKQHEIYLLAQEAGYTGTYEEWLESIKGEKGDKGEPGVPGTPGEDGVSVTSIDKTSSDGIVDTYTITLSNGTTSTFTVTNGNDGDEGLSAYDLYCKYYDYAKTEQEWVEDLVNGNLADKEKKSKKLTIAVYGDSISTKEGRNAVEITITSKDVGVTLSAYPTYHDIGTVINGYAIKESDIGEELTFTPTSADIGKTIGKVANYNPSSIKTWWEHVEEYFNCNINPVCWSSSSYSSHENSVLRLRNSYAWHDSQIRKLGTRIEGTNERIAPDVVILYRGCNDMTHSPYTLLTPNYFDDPEWKYPTTDVVEGGYGYKEALSLTIKKIREAYPKAQIVLATQGAFKRIDCDNFPTNNNLYSLPTFNKATREVADFFGCHTIDFDKCGITFENCFDQGYFGDTTTTATHPTNLGHKVMGEQAIFDLVYKLHLSPYVYSNKIEENKLYEGIAVNHEDGEFYEWNEYYSIDYIPVTSGKIYYMPDCRNTTLLDSDGNIIKIIHGPTMESNGFKLTIPNGVSYIRTCLRYDTRKYEDFIFEEVAPVEKEQVFLEKTAIDGSGASYKDDNYFSYDFVKIEGGKTYYMPNCRNTSFLDEYGNVIYSIGGLIMEANGFIVDVPSKAAYFRTCLRYDTLEPDDFYFEEYVPEFKEQVFLEKTAIEIDGTFFDTNDYFTYDYVKIEGGKTYYMPNCRNTAFLDQFGNVISTIYGLTMESNGFIAKAPSNAVYIRTCLRYDTLEPADFKIEAVEEK